MAWLPRARWCDAVPIFSPEQRTFLDGDGKGTKSEGPFLNMELIVGKLRIFSPEPRTFWDTAGKESDCEGIESDWFSPKMEFARNEGLKGSPDGSSEKI